MLGTVLILLACVNGLVSESYAPYQAPTNNGYQQNKNRNDFQQDIIRSLDDAVNAAYRRDGEIAERLTEAADEDALNTERRNLFLDKQFVELRNRQANQTLQIEGMGRRAEQLILLTVQRAVLNSSVGELQRQVNELAKESVEIQNEANTLQYIDVDQKKRLAAVKAQLAEQDRKLEELENGTTATRDSLNRNVALAENLTDVVDTEQVETVTVILTSDKPFQTEVVNRDFSRSAPLVFKGFSGIHISDESQSYVLPDNYATQGYGGYGASSVNSSIAFNIDVQYKPGRNILAFTLLDHSNGFTVVEVTVGAILLSFDNTVYEVDTPNPYPYK